MLQWIHQLKILLNQPLPGASAHSLMSPAGRGNTEEYIQRLTTAPKVSAVMLLLFPAGGVIKLVLIKRPDYQGVHSGQISFPGGKWEETDMDYEQTAFRETFEEVGVPKENIQLIGSLSRIYIPPSNFLVYPFVGFCPVAPQFKTDSIEVEKLLLPNMDVLLNEKIIKEGVFTSGGQGGWEIRAPYYEIENERVWGATAAILSEFKAIISTLIT